MKLQFFSYKISFKLLVKSLLHSVTTMVQLLVQPMVQLQVQTIVYLKVQNTIQLKE